MRYPSSNKVCWYYRNGRLVIETIDVVCVKTGIEAWLHAWEDHVTGGAAVVASHVTGGREVIQLKSYTEESA